jgi:CHAT domain-containing protein/tetratricopeptide (TPR) repeat protein
MKARKHIGTALALLLLGCFVTQAAPRRDLSGLRLLTSVPENDYEPTLSPNGEWLVFVSERTGDQELLSVRLADVPAATPIQIAESPADDHSPRFSPDGKWLSWVSTREDALGDIWVMSFPHGKPVQVSTRGIRDAMPRWLIRGGGTLLLYESRDLHGRATLFEAVPGRWTSSACLTNIMRDARIPPFGATVVQEPDTPGQPWVLAADDTNGDGRLDREDEPTAWIRSAAPSSWRQLTPPLRGMNSPCRAGAVFVLSLAVRDDLDVAIVETPFAIAELKTAGDAVESARHLQQSFPFDPFTPVAYLRQAYALEPGNPVAVSAVFQAARLLQNANRPEQGLAMLAYMEEQSELTSMQTVELRYLAAVLELAVFGRSAPEAKELSARQSSTLEELDALSQSSSDLPPALRAHIILERAALMLTMGKAAGALTVTRELQALKRAPRELQGRGAQLRGKIYERLGLSAETSRAYRTLVSEYADLPDLAEQAALRMVSLSIGKDVSPADQAKALRRLHVDSLLAVRAAAGLSEGRLLAKQGEERRAEQVWQKVAALSADQPRLAARAAFELAASYARAGKYQQSIDTYDSVATGLRNKLLATAPSLYRIAREGRISEYLAKGDNELRVGDPQLARATFTSLTRLEPAVVEGWRGLVEAQSRCDLLDDAALAGYQRRADAEPDSALVQYLYGLALTYRLPITPEAGLRIRRAILLNGAVPYFHQTLGFIHEHYARTGDRHEDRVIALQQYERALALLTASKDIRPTAYARLLINCGNAALTLGNSQRAADLYEQRLGLGTQFDTPANEFLMYRSAGTACFRAGRPDQAVAHFVTAQKFVPQIAALGLLDTRQEYALTTELLDREALALLDLGHNAEAAARFAQVVKRTELTSLNRVRALRNRGFALHRLSGEQVGMDRELSLKNAVDAFRSALQLLRKGTLTSATDRGGGLINLDIAVSADEERGGAKLDLSPDDEERLVTASLASTLEQLGEQAGAVEQLRAQLSLSAKPSRVKGAYEATVRQVALDRLAGNLVQLGLYREAARTLIEAIDGARFRTGDRELVNGNALSIALARMGEVALASDVPPFTAGELLGTWLLAPDRTVSNAATMSPLRALDRTAARALALRREDTGEPWLENPTQRARVLLARALVLERQAGQSTGPGTDPLSAVRAARDMTAADRLAQRAVNTAAASREGGEIKRVAILARALLLRQAFRSSDTNRASRILAQALKAADAAGLPHLRWWLAAQGSLAGADGARYALTALREIEAFAPGASDTETAVPLALLRHCERLSVAGHIARDAWSEVWSLTERWRVARLKLLLGTASPSVGSGRPEETEWLDAALALRAKFRRNLKKIHDRPATVPLPDDLAALSKAKENWLAHLDSGREAGFATALMLAPQAAPFDEATTLLDNDLPLPGKAALILSTQGRIRAWTAKGPAALSDESGWARIREQAPVWFVLGAPLPPGRTKGVLVVNMLTFETTFARLENPRLDVESRTVSWPGPGTLSRGPLDSIDKAVLGANHVQLTAAVSVRSAADPWQWPLVEPALMLGQVLERLPQLTSLDVTCLPPDDPQRELEMKIVLAAALATTDAATVRINSRQWLGLGLPISALPRVAETELAVAIGRAMAYLKESAFEEAVAPLRRALAIRQALKKPPAEVAEVAQALAHVGGRLKRWDDAAQAAGILVRLRSAEGDSEAAAEAMSLRASYLNDARRFKEAHALYEQAGAIYGNHGQARPRLDMLARSGVVLENGGEYERALSVFEEVRAGAKKSGDRGLEAIQLRRRGRIYLQRQNRYDAAEQAFLAAQEAAQAAGDPELAALATLDLARTYERLGLYKKAVATARKIATGAADTKQTQLQTDALLVQAYIEWARADYLKAFKLKAQAHRLAEKLADTPLRIIAHNTGGLIAWALNDTDAALREFDAALTLARQSLFPAEVASTLNNRGLVHRSVGAFEQALDDFRAALVIDRRQSNAWGIAYSQRNIGITHVQQGRPKAALLSLEEAIRLATKIGDRTNRTKALTALGDALRELGKATRARATYTEALDAALAIPLPEMQWRAMHGLALLAREAGEAEEALRRFDDAITVVERLRAGIRIEEFQDGFLLDKQGLYDEMIDLLLQEGKGRQAFEYSERSRGRNFIDLLGNQKINPNSTQDQESLDREASLRAEISVLERRVAAATGTDRAAAVQELDDAHQRYTALLIELRAENPELSSFVSVPPVDLAALQRLLDPATVLLVYHLLPDEIVAWVLSRTSLNVVRTPVSRKEVADTLLLYRQRLQQFDDISVEQKMLSGWLIEPVAPMLVNARRIGIVPHRELHRLPFAALQIGERALIDEHTLFFTPSASVLRYTFGRRAGRKRVDRVLAVGNPDLGNVNLDLPFAEKEAERIRWTFPEAKVLTGREATESWLSTNMAEYGIIHVACHGEYDPNLPLLSAVRLSADTTNDGKLTAQEIFGLSINADLVALSACQTGLGRLSNGDDIVGLNRAFVYAGTRQILSSLWRVDDVATAVLIKHFYRNLKGRSRADALRRAQLEIRKHYAHPAYWAGIFLSGDWQ